VSDYKGGIWSQKEAKVELNHEISVVGYGKSDEGEEYWIGRNSWGTYWGEMGFFRMKMYEDNLGIETDCTAGVPSYNPNVADTHTEALIQ
jgi:cathepsin X